MKNQPGIGSEPEKPDLLISVDFGMTCTGVAFINLSAGTKTPKIIQQWPGRAQANENKVPTVLVYPSNSKIPSSWGFKSEERSEQYGEDRHYREWFKTCLDPQRFNREKEKGDNALFSSMEDVEDLYRDYLRELYQHIRSHLGRPVTGRDWRDTSVEFLFSVPTTWEDPTIRRFASITREAGFGSEAMHRVSTSLTEAEAAAVAAVTEEPGIFKERDVLLVCDAGGGTTDLSALRVVNVAGGIINLQQLSVVFGEAIGSAAIDQAFEDLAVERLSSVPDSVLRSPGAAWEMMKSRELQSVKCEFGSPAVAPKFRVPVPTFDAAYTNEEAGIFHGEMQFKQEDLKVMFDTQVEKIDALIQEQLRRIKQDHPHEEVAWVILSGGLGKSFYVQTELERRYSSPNRMFSNTRNLRFKVAPEPQLAVCKGLIVDQQRRLESGTPVLNVRRCRASYGTLCKIEYDRRSREHVGKATIKDKRDGKLYLKEAIEWFIKKGEPINVDRPIQRSFRRKVDPANPLLSFSTNIVKSDADSEDLPVQMGPDAEILCALEADLRGVGQSEFMERNSGVFTTRKTYLEVNYDIQVIIQASDIRFDLLLNGRKLNNDCVLNVEWYHRNQTATPDKIANDEDEGELTPSQRPRRILPGWLSRSSSERSG